MYWLAEKGSRKQGSQAGDEDSSSIASASTLSSIAELGYDEGNAIEDDPFELAIDALYEKRCAGTAVKALLVVDICSSGSQGNCRCAEPQLVSEVCTNSSRFLREPLHMKRSW